LFSIYLEAIEREDLSFIPARFVKEYLELKESEATGKAIAQEKTRMAVDIVASLSEAEAVLKYRRLTGINQGSFLDYWE
jgi:dGTPase